MARDHKGGLSKTIFWVAASQQQIPKPRMTIPFRTYWRVMSRNKALASINLAGLALGMASCLFIFLYVHDELSYDSHHTQGARILRITADFVTPSSTDRTANTPPVLATELKALFPEIEETARFLRIDRNKVIRHQGQIFAERELYRADPSVFQLFSYTMLEGNSRTALKGPHQIVLTRAAREKYFGATVALGKTLEIDKESYEVAGVVEDLPQNSDLRFFMLLSMDESAALEDWLDFGYYTYALVKEEAMNPSVAQALEEKLLPLSREKVDAVLRQYEAGINVVFHVQHFQDLHFTPSLLADTPKGNIQYVYLFSVAAVLILLIACLNYINFAIAQSMARSREVGIRKAIGASLRQLSVHYIGESFAVTLVAIILAAFIVSFGLPAFNLLSGKEFKLADAAQPAMLLAAVGILVTVSMFAGSYSAFYTAAIRPVHALRGKITLPAGQAVRKTSLVAQFAISTGLLLGAVAISRQMTFMQTFDPGFRKDHVLVIETPHDTTAYPHVASLAAALQGNNRVTNVSIIGPGAVPGDHTDGAMMYMTTGENQGHMVRFANVDEAYIPLLGLQLKEGRNLDVNRPADRRDVVLVNEAFVQMMGWKAPLQQKVPWGAGHRQVVGVIRNFYYRSLHTPVEPFIIAHPEHGRLAHLLVSLQPTGIDDVIAAARQQWQQVFPDEPFVYRFLDDTLAAQYHKEKIVTRVVTAFSIVALAIAFLGLSGLTALSIYQRKKEIGIRKVIGARMSSLVWLFFREYGKLILIAFAITYPITGYLVNTWLETFSRHVTPGMWMYMLTGMGVVALALATASAGIVRIARANPAGLIRE